MAKKIANTKKYVRITDLPATRGMLSGVRKELLSEIRSLSYRMDSRFKDVEARFKSIDARFDRMESRFASFEATLQHMMNIVEEQNHRNNIVLESLNSLFTDKTELNRVLIS